MGDSLQVRWRLVVGAAAAACLVLSLAPVIAAA